MIKLNCLAPVVLTHKFLPKMVERGRGAVIFVASTAAYQATPFFSVYSGHQGYLIFSWAKGFGEEVQEIGY
uniref:Short-chain dehydrogenase/reductase SDR n=1 Tax=uncultured bacterium 122006-I05 TaxID=1343837 RepID=S4W7V9_9BACT|nr:hypothetical protein [uncultured bacterium 122006-I05]